MKDPSSTGLILFLAQSGFRSILVPCFRAVLVLVRRSVLVRSSVLVPSSVVSRSSVVLHASCLCATRKSTDDITN